MAKEVLVYGQIFEFTAANAIREIEEAKGEDLTMRINTDGGSPEDGWGLVAKFGEFEGKKIIKIDGKAHSFGAFFPVYADKATALDVSTFLIHRAGFPSVLEQDPVFMNKTRVDQLNNINTKLRTALEAKIDVDKFQKITGLSIDDIFSMEGRAEALLTAKEAKEIGLIDEVTIITPKQSVEIQASMYKIAAQGSGVEPKKQAPASKKHKEKPKSNSNNNSNYKDMSIEALKSENPDMYKEILEKGRAAEEDRIGAWMAFESVDPEAVAKGIKSGEVVSAKTMAEFAAKAMSPEALNKLKKESTGDIKTDEPTEEEKTEKEKEITAFANDVKKDLGIEIPEIK